MAEVLNNIESCGLCGTWHKFWEMKVCTKCHKEVCKKCEGGYHAGLFHCKDCLPQIDSKDYYKRTIKAEKKIDKLMKEFEDGKRNKNL